jgi:hypothetical protein
MLTGLAQPNLRDNSFCRLALTKEAQHSEPHSLRTTDHCDGLSVGLFSPTYKCIYDASTAASGAVHPTMPPCALIIATVAS